MAVTLNAMVETQPGGAQRQIESAARWKSLMLSRGATAVRQFSVNPGGSFSGQSLSSTFFDDFETLGTAFGSVLAPDDPETLALVAETTGPFSGQSLADLQVGVTIPVGETAPDEAASSPVWYVFTAIVPPSARETIFDVWGRVDAAVRAAGANGAWGSLAVSAGLMVNQMSLIIGLDDLPAWGRFVDWALLSEEMQEIGRVAESSGAQPIGSLTLVEVPLP